MAENDAARPPNDESLSLAADALDSAAADVARLAKGLRHAAKHLRDASSRPVGPLGHSPIQGDL